MLSRRRPILPLLLAAIAYAIVGVVTAALAREAASAGMRTVWRLAAWLLSLAVFLGHLVYERFRLGKSTRDAAARVALAVAFGAFILAVAGPVRSHWHANDLWRTAVLSLIAWPVLTGVPAFLAALAAGAILDRFGMRARTPPPTGERP